MIWGKDENLQKMLKIQKIFPKLYRCILYVVFHNLEPQNAGLVGVKKDLNEKYQTVIFCTEIEKVSIAIENVIGSEDASMHKAERPSSHFFQLFYILSG